MYFTTGRNPNEIGDFEVVESDGRLHVFHLCLPSHDAVGHLVSDDGINWEPLPAAIRTGDPGDCDADQIWTMGVFRKGGKWFMLYTALSERGRMQRVALATSDDLIRWEKCGGNPVISADPRWYEAEVRGAQRVNWRDPHVVEVDAKLHGFICARRNEGLLNRRGCAGHFTSDDGYHWEVGPPACTPSNCFDWECPSVFELDGRYYMVAIAGGCARQVYRVADRVEGPYRRPADDGILPGHNMSVRPCRWRGRVHLFHWQRGERTWGGSGAGYAMLASPKLARTTPDGDLVVESFDWTPMYDGPAEEVTAATPSAPSCGEWTGSGDELRADAGDGPAIWLTEAEHEDFVLTADLRLEGPEAAKEFGLALRADDTGDRAVFPSVVPGRFCAELVQYIHKPYSAPGTIGRGRTVTQSYHVPPAADGRYRLRVIAFGPSIEFSVNGRICLANCVMPRRKGRLGLLVEDGRAVFSNVRIQPLKPPACPWGW